MSGAIQRQNTEARVLQGVPSFVLNSPGQRAGREPNSPSKSCLKDTSWKGEVIPDSEEERCPRNGDNKRAYKYIDPNVIEISSDEDDTCFEDSSTGIPPLSKIPGHQNVNIFKGSPANRHQPPQSPPTTSKTKKTYFSRRIVESSSSEDSDSGHQIRRVRQVIDLSNSSSERLTLSRTLNEGRPSLLDDPWDDDGAILTLNEPKSARRPARLPETSSIPSTPRKGSGSHKIVPSIEPTTRTTDPTPIGVSSYTRPFNDISTTLSTPSSNKLPTKARQPPRSGKKAQAAVEQARREKYALHIFTELNHLVFKDGLPKDTKLNWNKRLLTTAGRAKWHRSRDGVETTEIELAEKILDCDERIRNTLSHEMCHLASWIIDADPKEGHGKLWKAWAAKVMQKHPEIEITTRHDYDISYPFEWECEKCAKIYGRFSKSIRPDECVCGACKEGKLAPLFSETKRVPKTPKASRMASAKPQDSPCSIPRPSVAVHQSDDDGNSQPKQPVAHPAHHSDSESDSDIEILTTAMGSVTIIASDMT